MKFIKGVMVGASISVGIWMMYSERAKGKRNKMMKEGKKFIRNIGII